MKKKHLVTAKEMKACDQFTIEHLHVPSMVLMERAALSVFNILKQKFLRLKDEKILILCGNGNNGGDGLAIARLLVDEGCSVDIVRSGSSNFCSDDNLNQLKIIKAYGQEVLSEIPNQSYTIIVDAIFGVGLSRKVEGIYEEWIRFINASKALVVAVDIPSGIDSDTGHCKGIAVRADITVTFEFKKIGHVLFPGRDYSGQVFCCPIGISHQVEENKELNCFTYEKQFKDVLSNRIESGNKGTFGKLLIVAGKKDLCGAAILCAESASRSGVGMVKVVTAEENRVIFQTKMPDVMLLTYKDEKINFSDLSDALNWANAVVVGPGMGETSVSREVLSICLDDYKGALILDADALNLIGEDSFLKEKVVARGKNKNAPLVLTPHVAELSRISNVTINQIKSLPLDIALKVAKEFSAIVVSKDATTVVCDERESVYVNTCGNCGMAVAGSGDVLAGIIGSFLAQRFNAYNENDFEIVTRAVYVHSIAGDIIKEILGETSMLASDIIKGLIMMSKESGKKDYT